MAKKTATTSGKRRYTRKYLVFIDTNIFLNFYRAQTKGLSLLSHLDAVRDRIITTEQVAMEYKKNRQKVILETHEKLSSPGQISLPSFLADAQAAKGIETSLADVAKRVKKIKDKLGKVLREPGTNDPVYQKAQSVFTNYTPYNLSRWNPKTEGLRFRIRRLAKKRFCLGYPPRKDKDNSIGDAVNWEWIVHCARESKSNVIIVTGDKDYGEIPKGKSFINDWLKEEFRERTSKGRLIVLTQWLSQALKLMGIKVSNKEEKQERLTVETGKEEGAGASEWFNVRNYLAHRKDPPITEASKKLLALLWRHFAEPDS